MYAKNASKLHKAFGDVVFTEYPWKIFKIKQEMLVKDLFPNFNQGNERYDYVIPELKVVVELHGKQHYQVATFGKNIGTAIMDFQTQQIRDEKKKEIAIDSGWNYIEIPFSQEKEINKEFVFNLLSAYLEIEPAEIKTESVSKEDIYKEKLKIRRRTVQREQYQKMKQWKKKHNDKNK